MKLVKILFFSLLMLTSLAAYSVPLNLCKTVFADLLNQPLNSLTLTSFTDKLGAGSVTDHGFQYQWFKDGFTLTVERTGRSSGASITPAGNAPVEFQQVFNLESSKPTIEQIGKMIGAPSTVNKLLTYSWSCEDGEGGTFFSRVTVDESGKVISIFNGAGS